MPHKIKKHHKTNHTKHYVKPYLPYLPLFLVLLVAIVFGQPWESRPEHNKGVLAYATNVTHGGLLQATNAQRTTNGRGTLSLNGTLNQAAQAKAEDMAARNYWSHNTPEGSPPWIFFDQAGYKYTKAGENLAYGFITSDETITGWMNSPSHRDNMLSAGYNDVGFGFANVTNYQNKGPQTVVVAMYGAQVQGAAIQAATKPATLPANKPAAPPAKTEPTPAPVPVQPSPPAPAPPTTPEQPVTTTPALASAPAAEPQARDISRIQTVSGGQAPWSSLVTGIVIGLLAALFVVKHGINVHRIIRKSERFVMHHPLVDAAILAVIVAGLLLTQTVGMIR